MQVVSLSNFRKLKDGLQSFEVVLVGDKGVGKTRLCEAFTTNVNITLDYIPISSQSYTVRHTMDGIIFTLSLIDTGGRSFYDRLRPLVYPRTDVFLICFSPVDPESYENARTKWYPEVVHHIPPPSDAKIVLVGTKLDLRDNHKVADDLGNRRLTSITYSQGEAMRRDIDAAQYFECSTVTHHDVATAFEETMRVFKNPSNSFCQCIIA